METKKWCALLLLLANLLPIADAMACSATPPAAFEDSEKRVRERYALAESVELVTMVDVQPITEAGMNGNTLLKGERVTFKVEKVFKGKSRPGDKIVAESTGMCAYSVAGNAALKNEETYQGWVIIPPRQWLFYRSAGNTVAIGESDMVRPINQAGFDLKILERWRNDASK
jgi:hypothetical protein